MSGTAYQILRLISRIRRTDERAREEQSGAETPPSEAADRVQISTMAREQANRVADMIRLPPGTPVSAATIVDQKPLPLATLMELERRAGSFMHPPFKPTPGPAPIPRAKVSTAMVANPGSLRNLRTA